MTHYRRGELGEADIDPSWYEQLRAWFRAAQDAPAIVEPNAIQLATVDAGGRPSVRTVLVKTLDERGIVFYTNYDSAKGSDLADHPFAAAVFAWLPLERQARLTGPVEKVSRDETEAYFASRPRGSQLGAWASRQSTVIGSRAELDDRYAALSERWPPGTPVPMPDFWGGYRVEPQVAEFWHGRVDRMHDRFRYRREAAGWTAERLAP